MSWSSKLGLNAFLIGLITTLEVLFHRDQLYSGLADYHGKSHFDSHYLWSLIPAIILFVLGVILGIFDFTVRSLAPFSAMAKKPCYASLLAHDMISRTSITVSWKALHQRHHSVVLGSIAVVLVQLTKIIVAGLFKIEDHISATPMMFSLNSTFNPSYSYDNSEAFAENGMDTVMLTALTQLDAYNMSLPSLVTD